MVDAPNDFAFLSDDIVYDVLQSAHFEQLREESLTSPTLGLTGRWAEISKSFQHLDNHLLGMFFNSDRNEHDKKYYSAKIGAKSLVSRLTINDSTHSSKIIKLTPHFYERLAVVTLKMIPQRFLAALGTRFTTITWRRFNHSPTLLDGEAAFFERQLKSPFLRSLDVDSRAFEAGEFADLLVNFVQKPHFQKLYLEHPLTLSEKVFQSGYAAWLRRPDHLHLTSSITAQILQSELELFTISIPDFSQLKRIQRMPTTR